MPDATPSIVDLIRARQLDAELGGLLWLLAANRIPVHVASPAAGALAVVGAIRQLASEPGDVTDGPESAIEDVLRQPVPLRPATGAVVILDDDARVVAAHLLRPPLRDGAGHVRPQGPGVLAVRLEAEDRLEHFAWGVVPEIAAELGRKGGDVEAELGDRAEMLDTLAASAVQDPDAVALALRGWTRPVRAS
jgi:hypothetical protein